VVINDEAVTNPAVKPLLIHAETKKGAAAR